MASFTARFKRVRSSGTRKQYQDKATGDIVSYRQALNRARAEGLTRKSVAPERQLRATEGLRRYISTRKTELKRRGFESEREFKRVLSKHQQDEINRYIKFQTWMKRPVKLAFDQQIPPWAKSRGFDEESLSERIGDIRDEYNRFVAGFGPVGGFIYGA
jgi:hypothetical protein